MTQENKMGVMPVPKLILAMSLPMIISMLVQALYNVVDSVFVARYSQDALAAVSYAFPAQNLMIGTATGTGVGVNALLSKSLGEKNFEKANKTAANGILLAGVGYMIFLLFGLFFAEKFIAFQTSTPSIIAEGRIYLQICTVLSFGIFGEIMFERLMQSTGKTIYTMFTQGIGAIVNIILDPIFIFGLLGFPRMGTAGAALATVLGQIVAFILGIILNHRYNTEIRIKPAHFKPDLPIIGRIYAVGIPSIIMVGIGSVTTTAMNKILNGFSDIAASVFGVYFKLQSFAFMPVFGLNNGVIPVIAYNYGARKRKRMIQAIVSACVIASCFMLVGLTLMQVIPEPMLRLFDAGEEMMSIGVPALRIISISFICAGICIALSSVFQALGRGVSSMMISFARQLVVLVPAAYLLSLSGNVNMVWWSYPIAEIMSILVSLIMFAYLYKTVISKIPE
ncbi:MAG: MATE family efflux transporter [Ruminococcaceae bacterium]|nr:MATE family efflux transporter [Oscillospiraceae bacterium]